MAHTQQSNNAAAAVFVFVLRPYMWIHTPIKYRSRGHISIHAMVVPRPYSYLWRGRFLFVPWPYLDWKHTHNNQRLGKMAHTQQLNNAAAAIFLFVPCRGRTQNNQTMPPRPYSYSCHGHAYNSQIMLPPVHTAIK